MLDFTDDQKLAARAIRTWCGERLAPKVPALESGALLPYDLMRDFAATFGLADMVRTAFAKMRSQAGGSGTTEPVGLGDGSLMAIVMMELSRVCPGFALAFGASVGLCGGAILARGTLAQKERFALPVMSFEKIGAWALTEPGAGSDAFSFEVVKEAPIGFGGPKVQDYLARRREVAGYGQYLRLRRKIRTH